MDPPGEDDDRADPGSPAGEPGRAAGEGGDRSTKAGDAHAGAFGGPIRYQERVDRRDLDRVRDLIDVAEGRSPVPLLDDAGIDQLLRETRRIAVIGASSRPGRPSLGVIRTLLAAGYEVVPVNPNETAVLGLTCYPDLSAAVAATGPIDLVDVFRRAELCVPHARDAVAVGARCFWLQLGIVNVDAARMARDAGLDVVMDRCTAIEVGRIRRP